MIITTRAAKRYLYLGHRWLGITTCLFFSIWLLSGMVMMYVPFPNLNEDERLIGLPEINWSKVAIAPNAALLLASRAVSLSQYPSQFRLEMMADEPVYRINTWNGERVNLSAVDGHVIDNINAQQAEKIAQAFSGKPQAHWVETAENDQWTVPTRFNGIRPIHRIALEDEAGTELYVSSRTGEVLRDTNRHERFWNWLGSVPHWIYFTPIKADQPFWRDLNLWVSGIAIVIPITGIWVGILRLRWRRRYKQNAKISAHKNSSSASVTPYQGWMKWHHIAGLIGGTFLLCWIISGWLSVNPNRWFAERGLEADALLRYAGHEQASFTDTLPPLPGLIGDGVKEARFVWQNGKAAMLLRRSDMSEMLIDAQSAAPLALSDAKLFDAAQRLLPEAKLVERIRLTEADRYWYSHHGQRKLPVLRAVFNDVNHTWIHIDPDTGAYLGQSDDSDRAQRWWFNGLHQMDYLWLVQNRPLWDGVMILFLLCALTISISGVVIGYRRLRHKVNHRSHHRVRHAQSTH